MVQSGYREQRTPIFAFQTAALGCATVSIFKQQARKRLKPQLCDLAADLREVDPERFAF
jgi:hypothetical protein